MYMPNCRIITLQAHTCLVFPQVHAPWVNYFVIYAHRQGSLYIFPGWGVFQFYLYIFRFVMPWYQVLCMEFAIFIHLQHPIVLFGLCVDLCVKTWTSQVCNLTYFHLLLTYKRTFNIQSAFFRKCLVLEGTQWTRRLERKCWLWSEREKTEQVYKASARFTGIHSRYLFIRSYKYLLKSLVCRQSHFTKHASVASWICLTFW